MSDSVHRGDERTALVADLRFLAASRAEYCRSCPKSQADMHAMSVPELAVHEEHKAAEWLANIIENDTGAPGWLPSWRWGEWEARRRGNSNGTPASVGSSPARSKLAAIEALCSRIPKGRMASSLAREINAILDSEEEPATPAQVMIDQTVTQLQQYREQGSDVVNINQVLCLLGHGWRHADACGELPWGDDNPTSMCIRGPGHEPLHRDAGGREFVSRDTIAEAQAMEDDAKAARMSDRATTQQEEI
jgi:hypothetical protein